MHHLVFHELLPLLFKDMMQIHEGIVFMDLSAVVYVLVLTRKGVTLNVKPIVINVVVLVAVQSQFLCSLF